MANLRITPINYLDDSTMVLTDTPALVTGMPVTNIQNCLRDQVARSTGLADQVIKGHWGGNGHKVDSLFLFRHTGQGGNVRLQLYTSSDWSGSPVYDSGVLPIFPLAPLETFEWGQNAALGYSTTDVLAAEAPYYLYFTATTCSSFVLTFSVCQYHYWEFNRIFLGKYLEAPYNPKHGMQVGWNSNDILTRTKGASQRTRVGDKWRELKIDMFYLQDSERALWRDLLGQVTMAKDMAVSVFPGYGGRQERDHVFNMQMSTHTPFAWNNVNFNETSIIFSEV